MNLHSVVSPYTAAVSPPVIGTLYVSAGNAIVDYVQTPAWNAFYDYPFDVQAMSGRDLRQTDALNIQGVLRAVYLQGGIEGLDRPAGKGGDVLLFSGSYWLVVTVLEPWNLDGWTKIAIQLQNGPPAGAWVYTPANGGIVLTGQFPALSLI